MSLSSVVAMIGMLRSVAIEHGQRLLAGAGAAHSIFPGPLEGVPHERAELRLVVDDEHVPHSGAPAEKRLVDRYKRRTRSTDPIPRPALLRQQIQPAAQRRATGAGWGFELAGGLGFEPRLAESESAVLPLDDPPTRDQPALPR